MKDYPVIYGGLFKETQYQRSLFKQPVFHGMFFRPGFLNLALMRIFSDGFWKCLSLIFLPDSIYTSVKVDGATPQKVD